MESVGWSLWFKNVFILTSSFWLRRGLASRWCCSSTSVFSGGFIPAKPCCPFRPPLGDAINKITPNLQRYTMWVRVWSFLQSNSSINIIYKCISVGLMLVQRGRWTNIKPTLKHFFSFKLHLQLRQNFTLRCGGNCRKYPGLWIGLSNGKVQHKICVLIIQIYTMYSTLHSCEKKDTIISKCAPRCAFYMYSLYCYYMPSI